VSPAANPYAGRYRFLPQRRGVWRAIVEFVARDIGPVAAVLELGPGYCDFINQYPAAGRIAIDVNPEMRDFAAPGVDFRVGDAAQLAGVPDHSVDLVFASHFLEHLTPAQARELLGRVRRALRPRGRLALLQPNFRLCPARYFDDPTHRTAYSDGDLANLLLDCGFRPLRIVPGLLPFSMRSALPKWYPLVRAYLALPVRPFAAQMYLVATPEPGPGAAESEGGTRDLER
jgi:SAM-dependent methyltransferase